MADIAVQADRLTFRAEVLSVVAAKTTGKILMARMIGKGSPGDLGLVEIDPIEQIFHHLFRTIDGLAMGRKKQGIILPVGLSCDFCQLVCLVLRRIIVA